MATHQDTGKFRENTADQFYTNPSIAIACVNTILQKYPESHKYKWIEPSAGSGAFLNALPSPIDKIGIDIQPGAPNIQQADFLTWSLPQSQQLHQPIMVFGNPPFGRQSATAKAFIAKACNFASIIAFILPKSFTKPSMYKAFDPKFHCTYSEEVPSNSFLINNTPYDVPCIFQIWERRTTDRPKEEKIIESGFEYIKLQETLPMTPPLPEYHIAFRRVGVYAGKAHAYSPTTQYSTQSHHFIRFNSEYAPHLNKIIEKINSHTFPSNTVGPRSLSKSEINLVLNRILLELSS
jgi:hypothetical protein